MAEVQIQRISGNITTTNPEVQIQRISGFITANAVEVQIQRISGSVNSGVSANAGPNQSNVEPLTLVVLDGSASFGTSPVWTQTSGPTVTIINPTTLKPSFIAPAGFSGSPSAPVAQTCVFLLTMNGTATSSVTITVLPNLKWRNVAGTWTPVLPYYVNNTSQVNAYDSGPYGSGFYV